MWTCLSKVKADELEIESVSLRVLLKWKNAS